MILIAHRGLADGPNPERENHPDQIKSVLDRGFDVEIDVRIIDMEPWLGHDGPVHRVTWEFLHHRGLWIHAKDLEALSLCTALDLSTFFHDSDEAVLTSKQAIWTYPGKGLFENSICVQPEWDENWRETVRALDCLGICSKHVEEIRRLREPV